MIATINNCFKEKLLQYVDSVLLLCVIILLLFLKHLVYIENCLKPKMYGSTISALQGVITTKSPCSEMSAHQTVPATKSPKVRTPKTKNLTPKRKLRRFK